jgi:hypothetical protein
MPSEPGEVFDSHAAYLRRHPPLEGTVLAREGCTGTLHVDSVTAGGRVVVRCDDCWAIFSIGPARAARKTEEMFWDNQVEAAHVG